MNHLVGWLNEWSQYRKSCTMIHRSITLALLHFFFIFFFRTVSILKYILPVFLCDSHFEMHTYFIYKIVGKKISFYPYIIIIYKKLPKKKEKKRRKDICWYRWTVKRNMNVCLIFHIFKFARLKSNTSQWFLLHVSHLINAMFHIGTAPNAVYTLQYVNPILYTVFCTLFEYRTVNCIRCSADVKHSVDMLWYTCMRNHWNIL